MIRALGMMSGTSMDGVDAALLETDGVSQAMAIADASTSLPYSTEERGVLFRAVNTALEINAPSAVEHADLQAASDLSTRQHIETAQRAIKQFNNKIDVIGYHGQTVLHQPKPEEPAKAFTLQLGDGQALANATGIPVVQDFRSADVRAGGQGAPLAPLYHQALLATRTPLPAVILNLGGIANITYVPGSDPTDLMAADIGPANVFMDDLMMAREAEPFDENGALAASGNPHQDKIDAFFGDPFFSQTGPKSLDRYSFEPPDLDSLSTPDAMATLLQLTVQSVVKALNLLPSPANSLWVAGGGARNSHLMAELTRQLPCRVDNLDALGSSAAMLEAEAFGFLAARHLMGLPTSYPNTTGAPRPIVGGVLIQPNTSRG